jgi:hypothetical protein
MTKPDKFKLYLYDLGLLLKERALAAKAKARATKKGSEESAIQWGRLLAFNETISIMQQQAEGFNIPLKDLRLEDVDPDKDLVA